jgi:hypothetical protein
MSPKAYTFISGILRSAVSAGGLLLGLGEAGHAGSLEVNLGTSGPGRVETPCPEPYQVGQGFVVYATPAPGARFLRWEDGSTNPERYLVLRPDSTNMVAAFETVPVRPFLQEYGLDQLDPSKVPSATLQVEGGRVRLEFDLPGRNAYRVLQSTNLATNPFGISAFATELNGPSNQSQAIGSAGPQVVWADAADPAHTFYQVEVIGGGVLPAVYLAQAPTVAAGQSFHLYGLGFSRGPVVVESDRGRLTAEVLNDSTLRVSAPPTAGSLRIEVRIGGALALGSIAMRVSPEGPSATVAQLPQARLIRGGLLRLKGSGLQSAQSAFVGSLPVQIVGTAADGTSVVLRLPDVGTTGVLSLNVEGQLLTAQAITVENSIAGYTPFATEGFRVTTTELVRPNQLTYVPFVPEGFRITTIGFVRPNLIDYVPFVSHGLLIETE